MRFLPFECLTIETHLGPEEAQQRLNEAVNRPVTTGLGFWLFGSANKPYHGNVSGYKFKIARVIWYRNLFLPNILGQIWPESNGSSIHVTMRPHVLALAFMVAWLGITGYQCLNSLGNVILSLMNVNATLMQTDLAFGLLHGVLFLFGYVLCIGSFKVESIPSKSFLRDLFPDASSSEGVCRYWGMTVTQIAILATLTLIVSAVWVKVGKLVFLAVK
jgi:hypothetical protein